MEILTLYSHYIDLSWLPELVEQHFPGSLLTKTHGEDGQQHQAVVLPGQEAALMLQSRQRRQPGFELQRAEDGLTKNLLGMRNFVARLPAENPDLQSRLLAKIETLNLEFSVSSEAEFAPGIAAFVAGLADKLDAIIFSAPNSLYPQLQTQGFLNAQGQLLLDMEGRSEATELIVNIDSQYFEPAAVAPDQEARKQRSEATLRAREIPVLPTLPVVVGEAAAVIRPIDEVVNRALALCYIGLKSEDTDAATLNKVARQYNIFDKLSREEKAYADDPTPTQEQAIAANWRYESLHVLLWALGFVEELTFPDQTCDVATDVGQIAGRSEFEFRVQARLRPTSEILDVLDLLYRCSWACVNNRVKGVAPPKSLDGSVVYEWHYALNWLTNYQGQAWDEVRTDT
ncbi:DUF4272 domain-containing protein [Hymenobacter terrenus]|uniref:DUF4272 domain-containing protein n=1 Tax=Hymenobacter terrenus TaxID=1629124 RepID=UPI000619CA08|nr:DUF4272 domain-containing protein [Hymenobacter terrenus]